MLLSSKNNTHFIINFRFLAIIAQLVIVFIASNLWHYQLNEFALYLVIALETIFTTLSFLYFRKYGEAGQFGLFVQILSDVVVLTLLLNFSGGATNAFVSLLLIPIAVSAVCLTISLQFLVLLSAIVGYSILLWLMPEHAMHHIDMKEHFIGMWLNFLVSALVVFFVVARMALSINKREKAIARAREEQLKQERLLTLGVASAQVTHQLATPIATVQLLIDELEEEQPNNVVIADVQQQLQRCSSNLSLFRQLARDVREQKSSVVSGEDFLADLQEHININFPNMKVNWINKECELTSLHLLKDPSLLPAVLNLVQNAIRASKNNGNQSIDIISQTNNNNWQLLIRDFGLGFSKQELSELGVKPVISEQGMGMAVFLSHASFERLNIKLSLSNYIVDSHVAGGQAILSIPIQTKPSKVEL